MNKVKKVLDYQMLILLKMQ